MSLSKKEINDLIRFVSLTKEGEINCERCLELVAEFAERELTGRSIPAGLEVVAHHLSVCPCCREEYEALLEALKVMDG